MAYVKCLSGINGSEIPEGSTATPTDVVETLLNCAGIFDKEYTTIAQLLADTTSLNTVITSNNAIDYLVRSTTWASDMCADSTAMSYIGLNNYASNTLLGDSTWCSAICNSTYFESVLNVKVPTLSQNTNEIISNGEYGDDWGPEYSHPQYRAFDNDDSTDWLSRRGIGDRYIGYDFNDSVQLGKVTVNAYLANNDLLIKGSNDGTNWTTIKTISKTDVPNYTTVSFDIFSLTKYSKYIAESYVPYSSGSNYAWYGYTIQFYGRADV